MHLKQLKSNVIYVIILISAFLIRMVYLSYTDYNARGHDAQAHLQYVNHIATQYTLPSPDACWECWQPPLYYVVGAFYANLSRFLLGVSTEISLQHLSLINSMVFLAITLLILKRLFSRPYIIVLGLIIVSFFPSGIIHSVRIGNDSLYYALSAISLYFFIRWDKEKKSGMLLWGMLAVCLTIATKTNGVIFIPLLSILFLVRLAFSDQKTRMLKTGIVIFSLLLLTVLFTLRHSLLAGKGIVANSSGLNGALKVNNDMKTYTQFSVLEFVENPYTDPWSNTGGRQYFLTYLAKTSMYGEFSFLGPFQTQTARFINISLLAVGFFTMLGITHILSRKKMPGFKPMFIYAGLSFLLLIVFRFYYPYACSNDFRYIFPTVIPFTYFILHSIQAFQRENHSGIVFLYFACNICFIMASVVFFLLPLIN